MPHYYEPSFQCFWMASFLLRCIQESFCPLRFRGEILRALLQPSSHSPGLRVTGLSDLSLQSFSSVTVSAPPKVKFSFSFSLIKNVFLRSPHFLKKMK